MLSAALIFALQVGPNPSAPALEPLPFELRRQQSQQEQTEATPTADPLALCLIRAEDDPVAAQAEANIWLETTIGLTRAHGLHCRGYAEAQSGNWEAAAASFVAARSEPAVINSKYKARLGAIAANALITSGDAQGGLAMLDQAIPDAARSGFAALEAEMWLDRARAQVALGEAEAAGVSLASARRLAPSSSQAWLLSATLSRRSGDLETARTQIKQAAKLNLTNPEIALEAGVIAILAGDEDSARQNWQTVIRLNPNSPAAATAQGYLEQLTAK